MQITPSQTCTYLGPDYDPQTWHNLNPGQSAPFCGCASMPGRSYCEHHYPIVYSTGSALRKRHKDIRRKQSIEDTVQMIIDIAEELEAEGWRPEQGWEELDAPS